MATLYDETGRLDDAREVLTRFKTLAPERDHKELKKWLKQLEEPKGKPELDPSTVQRAKSIIIPEVDFRGALIQDIVGFFQEVSNEYSKDDRRLNVLLISHDEMIAGPKPRRVTLSVKDVSLYDAIRYTTEAARPEP